MPPIRTGWNNGPRTTDESPIDKGSSMPPSEAIPERLLEQARAGDQAARGQLLELYRNYLRLMARSLINQPLRVRLDASDLVQETFLKAHREFVGFLGSTEPELVTWLRRILVRSLADQLKRHRAGRRDYRREESVEVLLDRSSLAIQERLAAPVSSPSAHNPPRTGRAAGRRIGEIAR